MKRYITFNEAIALLNEVGCSFSVVQHCVAVSILAYRIAKKIESNGIKIDAELVRIGGLLHDIGRSKTHGIDHAVVGAGLVSSFNLPISIVRIVERHIGSGISANEAVKLGLPKRDFIPEKLEEKIVSYADKLIEDNQKISFDEALKQFSDKFGESHELVNRFKQIHIELNQKLEKNHSLC